MADYRRLLIDYASNRVADDDAAAQHVESVLRASGKTAGQFAEDLERAKLIAENEARLKDAPALHERVAKIHIGRVSLLAKFVAAEKALQDSFDAESAVESKLTELDFRRKRLAVWREAWAAEDVDAAAVDTAVTADDAGDRPHDVEESELF